jgi:excisionase family DNA binding protein
MPRTASDWITLAEAADVFAAANVKISQSTLARWARSGKLQSIRPGRKIFVRRAQVRSMLQPNRRAIRADQLPAGLLEDWER